MQIMLKLSVLDNTIESNIGPIFEEVNAGERIVRGPTRKGQEIIRKKTLKLYSYQCALCDIRDPRMLVAAHISDWSKDVDNRGLLRNVICMCKIHDSLFGLHELEISEDYTVDFSL